MTSKELYEEIKQALDYLGAGFHGMDKVQIVFEGEYLWLEFEGRKAAIEIPTRSTRRK